MLIIKQLNIGNRQYSVAEINRRSGSPWYQFWKERTTIWTSKYGECVKATGWETDQSDRNSSYLVLVEGFDNVIAGTRVIHADPAKKTKLPLEECLHYHIGERAAEVSRFFFNPSDGSTSEEAKAQLKLFIWGIVTSLQSEGYQRAYATVRASLFKKLQKLGVPMQLIDLPNLPKEKHGNKDFVPAILFDPDAQRLAEQQPESISSLVAA